MHNHKHAVTTQPGEEHAVSVATTQPGEGHVGAADATKPGKEHVGAVDATKPGEEHAISADATKPTTSPEDVTLGLTLTSTVSSACATVIHAVFIPAAILVAAYGCF